MELIHSQNSDVAILGNVVVRRPRYSEAIAGVRREATILPRLRHRLVLPVPEIQIVEISDQVIALHQCLSGEPLRSVQDLPSQTQDRLALQLGSFLQSLHQIEPDLLSDIQLPHIDQRWWTDFLDRVERLIFPRIASSIAQRLRCQIQSHIQQLPNLPRVLRHGDFGSSNILWDGEGNITGIIDFASVGWGDPGWDIAGLVVSYGRPFVQRLASIYPVEPWLERSPYRSMFALMDALFGAEHGDSATLQFGLDTIKSDLIWNT